VNKLVIAAISGVILSLAMAFGLVYFTTYYYISSPNPTKIPWIENKTVITDNSIAPVYVLTLSNNSYKSETALLASLPLGIVENSSLNGSPQFVYNKSVNTDVFYIKPSFIIAKPNSTISFILYFNMTYLKLYNDSIYTDQIGNIVRVINITPINSSNSTMTEYKVELYIGDVNQNTLIVLPVWDANSLEIEYVIILVC